MSNEKDDAAKGQPQQGNKPGQTGAGQTGGQQDGSKKPYATIDLTAKDVTPKPTSSAAASASATGSSSAGTSSAASTKSSAQPTGSASAKSAPSAAGGNGQTASAKSPTPPPTRSGGAGMFQTLVSGAVGGVLTLLGLGSLGLLGDTRGNEPLAQRITTLEQQKAAPPTIPSNITDQLAAADARIRKMEEAAAATRNQLANTTKALEEKVAGPNPAATAAVERIAQLEAQLKEIAAAAKDDPKGGRIPALAQITSRIGELDTALTTRTTAVRNELSQDVEQRLAKVSENHEADRARLAQRAQSIEQTMKSVTDETTALRTAVDGFKTDLDTRFKAAAKPADITSAIEPVTTKLTALEKNVASVVRSEADRNATAGNVLLSIELNSLKRALDRGGRYTAELAAVKRVAGDKLNFAVLETAQETGIPSTNALLTEFRALAYKMLDAEAEPTDAGVLERLMAGAKSVVRVRKVDHAAGDTGTEATIGRMETALKDNRLGDVLDESKKLSDKARAPAGDWLKKIEGRFAIDKSLATIEASLKTAIAGSPPDTKPDTKADTKADAKKGTN